MRKIILFLIQVFCCVTSLSALSSPGMSQIWILRLLIYGIFGRSGWIVPSGYVFFFFFKDLIWIQSFLSIVFLGTHIWAKTSKNTPCTLCPKSLDPFHIVTYYIKLVKTLWTYSTLYIRSMRWKNKNKLSIEAKLLKSMHRMEEIHIGYR